MMTMLMMSAEDRVPQEGVLLDRGEGGTELQARSGGDEEDGVDGQRRQQLPSTSGELFDGETLPQTAQRRRQRRRQRHHNRMRMHDGNVRRLIACDVDTDEAGGQACSCETAENLERIGNWGTKNPPKPQTKSKKPAAAVAAMAAAAMANSKFTSKALRTYGSAGTIHSQLRDRGALREEDCFRFRHYEDVSLFMKQYRQQHTICIQGSDPTGPPVLGRDTPDPYLAKLRQCGDLLEQLLAFTAMARKQAEEPDPRFEEGPRLAWVDLRASEKLPRLPAILEQNRNNHIAQKQCVNNKGQLLDRPLTKTIQHEKAARDFSASSSPELTRFQFKVSPPRKAINLAPIRDCRLAVTNIKFPQAAPPRRQPNHIQQQQQKSQQQHQKNQQHVLHNHFDLQSARVPFPLPVRIVVNPETLKGTRRQTTVSPPRTPPIGVRRRLSQPESLRRHVTDKLSEPSPADDSVRSPPLSASHVSAASDAVPYKQYLAQRTRLRVKAGGVGQQVLFSANATSQQNGGGGGDSGKRAKPTTVGLCELYSSGSATLIAPVDNR